MVHEPVGVSVEAAQPLADVGLRRHARGRNSFLGQQFARFGATAVRGTGAISVDTAANTAAYRIAAATAVAIEAIEVPAPRKDALNICRFTARKISFAEGRK